MRYRKLGQTELKLSVLGFGAATLGNVYADTNPSEAARAVHTAVDLGINYFDVSPYYGLTLAEERLGASLLGRREKVIVSTKCGRYGVDNFNFSAGHVIAGFEQSLQRLRTSYVDLLLVHDVEFGSVTQIVEETLPALRRIQQQGKARYIGITGYSLKTLAEIARATPVDAVLTYCRYNLMITDMERVLLPVAKELGFGLINASPMHMGLLTEAPAPAWHPAPAAVQEAALRAKQFAQRKRIDLKDAALRFCLEQPDIASTLTGMSSTREVTDNLRSLEDDGVSEEEWSGRVQAIRETIGPALDCVWPSGLKENYG